MVDPTSLSLALSALEDYTQRDDVMKVVSSEAMNKGVNNSIEFDLNASASPRLQPWVERADAEAAL
jgi:hypothetical protein